MDSWPLAGLHLLERNQQVFIIALGESILLLGGTLVGANLLGTTLLAALLGFAIIVTLWWLYFVHTTETGEHAFESDGDHTRMARSGPRLRPRHHGRRRDRRRRGDRGDHRPPDRPRPFARPS